MRKSLALLQAGVLLVVWCAFSDHSISQSNPAGKTAPSGMQAPPARESHSKIKMERERCLACHESLPRDMNDPVYKKCDLYNHCSVCHGNESGMGDGPAAPFLYPKPRDFSRGLFKLRSTATGEAPTEHDLFKVITRGIPGSAMPTFAFMTDLERSALADHIKTLGRVFEQEGIKVPPSPPVTADLIEEGQKVYDKLKCAECHGDYGAGDGTASGGLKDDWGHSISPNDLTRGIYKGGEEPQEVYLRVTGGMNGTPMPSYMDSTTPQERWALVAFLLGKLARRTSTPHERFDIPAKKIQGLLPSSLDDPTWDEAENVTVSFSALWQKVPEIGYGNVRALYNDTEVTILLEWSASRPATSFARHQDFTDACALQFPVYETSFSEMLRAKPRKVGSLIPSYVMGDKGAPVNIWYWRSEEADTANGQVMEDYLLDNGENSSPPFQTGRAVGNPFSLAPGMSAMDMIAEGLGTLTPVPQDFQKVHATSIWKGGRWRVAFTRPLNPEFAGGARFAPGERVPISFAIWNGSKGERDGHKSVAGWHFLVLEK